MTFLEHSQNLLVTRHCGDPKMIPQLLVNASYPAFTSIKGPELAQKMTEHAQHYENVQALLTGEINHWPYNTNFMHNLNSKNLFFIKKTNNFNLTNILLAF